MARWLALGALLTLCALSASSAPAVASRTQTAMFEDPGVVSNPGPTLHTLRLLGADEVRLYMPWSHLAPSSAAKRRPSHFRAADPASYPDGIWAPWDEAIRQTMKAGMTVDLDVAGGAPRWALGPGLPTDQPHPSWAPDSVQYGAFFHAVATRYSGDYDPLTHRLSPGNAADLPAVRFWSVWNEPDYGPSLAPQGLPGRLSIEHSPMLYRGLLDAAWSALTQTGHGHDTVLFGELAPRGGSARATRHTYAWGVFSGMKPLTFLRALYCVGGNWQPLQGVAAKLRGCPPTAAGARGFRSSHPALFQASGVSDHPYSRWYPPNVEAAPDPDYSPLAEIGRLEQGLDRLQRVYGSNRRLRIWNTEYGYITSPPKHSTRQLLYVSDTLAAAYLNQAEYISWRDPRIASYSQYLLGDPLAATPSNSYGGFASGLISFGGHPKVTYSAFRMPVYLPRTGFRSGRRLEVWGCVRPAFFTLHDVPKEAQRVEIQFAASHSSRFTTVTSVPITDAHGYFDTHVAFRGSGTVRLVYHYPPDDPNYPARYPVYSRHVAITAG